MNIPATMTVARMHEVGGPLIIEELDTPRPGAYDVLVRVRACGIVPNLPNILANWSKWYPEYPLPPLPAIFGLDPAGEIVAVGEDVLGFEVGQRVYVNPKIPDSMSYEEAARLGYIGTRTLFSSLLQQADNFPPEISSSWEE